MCGMDKAQSDLIVSRKLETEFYNGRMRHTAKGRYRREEDWRNCGELGKGGSGVVHKQIEVTTGRYRAVKTIDKKQAPDYSRELHVMTILEEVCVLTPEGIHPILFLLWECLLV